MSGWFQNQLKDAAGAFFGSDYLRDYSHASKALGSNLYQYSPKLKFLFHCYFNINSDVYDLDKTIPGNSQNFGILVRDVKLPGFNFQTYQMNQYNRKRIIQTKIKYDPVTFTFIDDNSNTMAKLWNAYYTYYYNDGAIPLVSFSGVRGSNGVDLSSALQAGPVRGLAGAGTATSYPEQDPDYKARDIYNPNLSNKLYYGYDGSNAPNADKPNFFNEITIYGFYQKSFIAYTLINPIITTFSHDTYNYDESNGIMKNTMTLDYETVVYNEGKMDGSKPSGGGLVPGFAEETVYDRVLSPISMPGSNGKVLGQGGLVDSVGGALGDFQNNPLGGIKTLGTAYNTFKNTDLKQTLKQELKNSFLNNLRQRPNESRNLSFQFDNPSSGVQNATQAGSPPTGTVYGTDSSPNTNPNNGTDIKVNAQGNPVFNTVKKLGTQIGQAFRPVGQAAVATRDQLFTFPNLKKAEAPAGTQSNSGGGVNLPKGGR